MVRIPKPIVDNLADNIKLLSELSGFNLLKISLVKTPAAIFNFEFKALVVANIIPPIISPIMPDGRTSLHIKR